MRTGLASCGVGTLKRNRPRHKRSVRTALDSHIQRRAPHQAVLDSTRLCPYNRNSGREPCRFAPDNVCLQGDAQTMPFSKPVTEIIQVRYSCRTYEDRTITADTRKKLSGVTSSIGPGPFGTSPRFELVAATGEDQAALRGLGTYGFIKGATGFIVGAMSNAEKSTEDYGYLMELLILHATDLGLGTCWLGGSFTKSSFAAKIGARDRETVPAVTAVGYIAKRPRTLDPMIRRFARFDQRLPWQKLFFNASFGRPLQEEDAGAYSVALEMVRLGPSASNKQPWRVVKSGEAWHFYLARTKGYGQGRFQKAWMAAGIQRLDMGIAMCHFEQTARELGLRGHWEFVEPDISGLDGLTEYTASWIG